MQRVGDDLHTLTKRVVDVYFLVLVIYGREEKYKSAFRLEKVSREKYEIGNEVGKFIGLRRRDVRGVLSVLQQLVNVHKLREGT